MSIKTDIGYCDSTGNIQMGCEGCELVKGRKTPVCYAKTLADRYGGTNKGFPAKFEQPVIFMERLKQILSWSDLTLTERPDKPYLNRFPRLVFLNDMGDTFTKGLPEDWFAEALPALANSPHQYLVLTKWPLRFAKFAERHPLPDNIWAGTTVTSEKTLFRIEQLKKVKAKIRWVSIEPLWDNLGTRPINLRGIDWVVVGGQSGAGAPECKVEWIQSVICSCEIHNKPIFVKQLGSYTAKALHLQHRSGADSSEWPPELRRQEFPFYNLGINWDENNWDLGQKDIAIVLNAGLALDWDKISRQDKDETKTIIEKAISLYVDAHPDEKINSTVTGLIDKLNKKIR